MSLIKNSIDFILHLDKYLAIIIQQFGPWTYAILFLIVFAETGLVVTPFLPGDSLLFAAGAFAAIGSLNVFLLWVLLVIAAIAGDALNYYIGKKFEVKVLEKTRWVKKEHLNKTHEFYQKYGAKTIVLARFVPIVRTFAPFVAGVGKMSYAKFATYNVLGALLWVTLFVFGGYYFGNMPFVKENFSIVIIAIIVLSIAPIIFEYVRHKRRKK